MKKYYLTFGLLLCFGIIHAQLSQYEYWFDDNFAGRVTRSIGGSDASISELDAAHLSDGLHYWHLRVKNTDGSYSGITSGVFFKSLLGTDAKLEYWYNDDFESRKLIPSPAGEDISVNEDLDLFDMPSGLNRLNMRVANGAVSASYLMKTEVGATDKLEYWYNDDFESRTLVSPAEVGETAENGRLDVRAMPFGLNRFHLRFADGAVHTSYVMKSVAGSEKKLEYWFDDNYSGSKTISSDVYADEVSISSSIDAGGLDEGMHRVHFRPVSNVTEYASISTDFFFKGKKAEEGSYEVTHAKYWVDGNKSQSVSVPVTNLNYSNVFTTFMDADTISFGNHTLGIQIMNSAGMWSAIDVSPFEKVEYNEATVNLAATVKDNMVYLQWNSLPDIAGYRIYRDNDPVGTTTVNTYPLNMFKVDHPVAGVYQYSVKARSALDSKVFISNAVNVELNATSTSPHLGGSIEGTVRHISGALVEDALITLITTGETYIAKDGHFKIDGLPYGTSGTISVVREGFRLFQKLNGCYFGQSGDHCYGPITFEITEDEPEQSLSIVGWMEYNYQGYKPADLQLMSAIDEDFKYNLLENTINANTPFSFSVDVKNNSAEPWKGSLSLMVNAPQGSTMGYSSQEVTKVEILKELEPGEYATVTFDVPEGVNYPNNPSGYSYTLMYRKKTGDYYGSYKNVSAGVYANPIVVGLVNESVLVSADQLIGQLDDAIKNAKTFSTILTAAAEVDNTVAVLSNNKKPNSSLLADFYAALFGELKVKKADGQGTVNPPNFQTVNNAAQIVGDIIDWIKTADELWKGFKEHEPEAFFKSAQKIYSKLGGPMPPSLPSPVQEALKVYFAVGESYANAIQGFSKMYFDANAGNVIHNASGSFSFEIAVYPFTTDFVNLGTAFTYSGNDIRDQIKDVWLQYEVYGTTGQFVEGDFKEMKDPVAGENTLGPVVTDRHLSYTCSLKNSQALGGDNLNAQVRIRWKNGRVIWIPLTSTYASFSSSKNAVRVSLKSLSGSSKMADKIEVITY